MENGDVVVSDKGAARFPSANLDLGHELIRVVSSDGEIAESIKRRSKTARHLLESVWTPRRRAISPAALVVRDDAPAELKTGKPEAIVSFRNAVAFSHILISWARFEYSDRDPGPLWSDYFDFHPSTVGLDGSLITHSPALLGWDPDARDLTIMTSPHLRTGRIMLRPDRYLQRVLRAEWHRCYLDPGDDDDRGRRLFRSLESAYHASSLAVRNEGSVQEYGIQLALWVSALELLAGPERSYVGEREVLELIGKHSWSHRRLTARWYQIHVPRGNRKFRGNLIQRLGNLAYRSRNDFLHGNPVDTASLESAVRRRSVSLILAMPLIYRAALGAFLEERYPRRTGDAEESTLVDRGVFDSNSYDRALLRLTHEDVGWNDA